MNKWNLIVDVAKCNNCNNCTMVMKDEYVGNEFPGYSAPQPKEGHEWITIDRHIRGNAPMVDVTYVPRTCNHCDNAPCVAAGKGAVTKREDAVVIIDPRQAKGRKDLVDACPYGAIWWNEELQLPQHWTFDAHLLDAGWTTTRSAQACATGALRVVKLSDEAMAAKAIAEKLSVLQRELGTRPRVYYRGLEAVQTCFLGGNVAARGKDGLLDNVEGATVEVTLDQGRRIESTKTDAYGDFKIDGLEAVVSEYRVLVHHPELGKAEAFGTLFPSLYIGTLELG
jgi:Fe-S-cluster-containing dehydrogenase component